MQVLLKQIAVSAEFILYKSFSNLLITGFSSAGARNNRFPTDSRSAGGGTSSTGVELPWARPWVAGASAGTELLGLINVSRSPLLILRIK